MKKEIKYIVIHCTASSQKWTAKDLDVFFHKVRMWRKTGYHYVIETDGNLVQMAKDEETTNGAYGFNMCSVHVAYIGGIDGHGKSVDNRTDAQKKTLRHIVEKLHERYPAAKVLGHRDLPHVHKDCPCFDVQSEFNFNK